MSSHIFDAIEQKEPERIWPVKPALVSYDETEYWNFDEEDVPLIERMMGTYLTDRGVGTHLCSFEANYWLEFISHTLHCRDDVSDDDRQRLYDKYEHEGGYSDNDHYRTCGSVDRYIEQHPDHAHVFEDVVPEDATDATRDDIMEGFREHVLGNSYF